MAITFAAISEDVARPPGDDLRGPADARDGDPHAAPPAPVPARLHDPLARARARHQRPAPDAAGPERRDRGRHPGPARSVPTNEKLQGVLAGAQPARRAALDEGEPHPPARPLRHRPPAGRVREPGADGLQLRQLLDDLHPERALRPRPGRLQPAPAADRPAERRRSTSPPGRPTSSSRARSRRRSPATAGSRRTRSRGLADPSGPGVFKPYELPIVHAPGFSGPTGQAGIDGGDDCQGGQTGYAARPAPPARPAGLEPGLRAVEPARLARPDDPLLEPGRHAPPGRHPRRIEGAVRPGAHKRLPNWGMALIAIVLIAIGVAWAFTKKLPWSDPYEVQAVFPSAQNMRTDSPVRIAGVNVGKVTKVEPAGRRGPGVGRGDRRARGHGRRGRHRLDRSRRDQRGSRRDDDGDHRRGQADQDRRDLPPAARASSSRATTSST